jgi:hypothetical protein
MEPIADVVWKKILVAQPDRRTEVIIDVCIAKPFLFASRHIVDAMAVIGRSVSLTYLKLYLTFIPNRSIVNRFDCLSI